MKQFDILRKAVFLCEGCLFYFFRKVFRIVFLPEKKCGKSFADRERMGDYFVENRTKQREKCQNKLNENAVNTPVSA